MTLCSQLPNNDDGGKDISTQLQEMTRLKIMLLELEEVIGDMEFHHDP